MANGGCRPLAAHAASAALLEGRAQRWFPDSPTPPPVFSCRRLVALGPAALPGHHRDVLVRRVKPGGLALAQVLDPRSLPRPLRTKQRAEEGVRVRGGGG